MPGEADGFSMGSGTARERARRGWVGLVAIAMLAAGCSTGGAQATVAPEPVPSSLPLIDAEPELAVAEPADTTTTTTSSTTTTSTIPPDPYRSWVATAQDHIVSLAAYEEPGGLPLLLPFRVPNPHQFGGPLTLLVVDGQPGDEWLEVQLPIRPNGQTGWIRASDYDVTSTRVSAEVDLSEHSVVVYDGEEIIAETAAVVGKSETPTPLGTFFIAAKKQNGPDETFLGPWALVLSGYSEVLETFGGGLPVIAVHGTSRPDQVGQSLSNGCIRIPNDVVEFLAENVPLGAPITISA